jgi:hypothetical protein
MAFYEVIEVPNDRAAPINSIAVYHRRITGEFFCGSARRLCPTSAASAPPPQKPGRFMSADGKAFPLVDRSFQLGAVAVTSHGAPT